MEDAMRRSNHHGDMLVREEECNDFEGENCRQEVVSKIGSKRPYLENDNPKSSSPEHKDSSLTNQVTVACYQERSIMEQDSKAPSSSKKDQEDPPESATAEMGKVREENRRLKVCLNQIMKDYQTLQMQFHRVIQQEESKKSKETVDHHQSVEEAELVSLCLRSKFSSELRKDNIPNNTKTSSHDKYDHVEQVKEGLPLELIDSKLFEVSKTDGNNEPLPNTNPSPLNSFDEPKEDAGETWPPSKVLKTMRSGDDEVQQQNPAKKARVSVRVRCDTPTMTDGCQWRKYGQKIAKGNPCPRAYYRCTVAPSCPVRKQVQRCAEDMSILITTYEGAHNHPLPISATAMASTTSAAASMLLSGASSCSKNPLASTATADLHGLNHYLSYSSKSNPLYMYNPSILSPSPPHPTITLDLTSSASSSAHFNRFPSSYPKFASTSTLNFSSSEYNTTAWGNGFYGSTSRPYNKNQINPEKNFFQSSLQKNNPTPPQHPSPDTIAAATKAITADPSFQSALEAALTSIIGSGNGNAFGVGGSGGASLDGGAEKLKWSEHFPEATHGYTSNPNVNACATSNMTKTPPSTNLEPGKLMFLPSSLTVSSPRSASTSPDDKGDRIN